MELGGLLARGLLLKDQLHVRPCERCGQHYDTREPTCPHCGGLDADGLRALLAEKDREKEGNAGMGRIFLLIGAVLAALVLIGVLSL
jgi:ribosomal protein L37E